MSPGVPHRTHSDVWMQGLDNFKTVTKETGGNRNLVPTENVRNLMDCEKM